MMKLREALGRAGGAALMLVWAGMAGACGAGAGIGAGGALGSPATVAEGTNGPPTVALARGGDTAYVVWVETRGDASNVMLAAVTPDGRPLRAAVRVNSTPGDASTHDQAPPQVAGGPRGEVYVVWQKSTEVAGRMYPISDLRFAYSTDGGRTFSPTITVNDDAGGLPTSHSFHNVTVGADGTVYVGWLDGRAQDAARAKRKPQAGEALSGAHEVAGGHEMAGMHAHAHDPSLPGSEIRVASWRPGDTAFSRSTRVDGNVCPCCRASLAVGPDGAVHVAWRKVFTGNVRDVVVARSTDGGRTFSPPVKVHDDGWVFPGCPHAGPSLAVDANGRIFASWYTGKKGREGLYYAVSEDGGGSFGDAVPLVTGDFVPVAQARLAAGVNGIWAAWGDPRGENEVHVGRLDGTSVADAGTPEPGRIPSIAFSAGKGVVAWRAGQTVRMRSIREAR